ncbi:hypothetical protein QE408_003116 [Agrobacterium larrymoorei]|uniref:Uncharacterized protein n=1 Tax=Agrobacterium larrymoorei TaxID=160699 RepID=A0ABU0UMF1_9HYPH|nr:hypothetical protein [Agrobacterium larrymoorei]
MSMYAIFDSADRNRRIGTVMKFVGNPPARRWVAFAAGERKEGFRTLRKAGAWLREEDASRSQRAPEGE